MPKVPSAHCSAIEEAVLRIVDLETEVSNGIAGLMQLKKNIGESIRGINSMECETILEMRYLTFMTWEQIAAQLNYSNDYIYHLHRKALSLVRVLE
jgi:DNA-directed RNA polymerase specialized sigma subunit